MGSRKSSSSDSESRRGVDAASCLDHDSVDLDLYMELVHGSEAFGQLEETGSRLIPHMDALLFDLFCAFFKLNVLPIAPSDEGSAATRTSTAFNRTVIDRITSREGYPRIREVTSLDAFASATAALRVAESILLTIKKGEIFSKEDLLDGLEIARREEEASALEDVIEAIESEADEEGEPEGEGPPGGRTERIRGRLEKIRSDLAEKGEGWGETISRVTPVQWAEMVGPIDEDAARDIEDARARLEHISTQLGTGLSPEAAKRIDLAKRLGTKEKILKLATLVGRFRDVARSVRRKVLERSTDEIHEVGVGRDLGRILPSELALLAHPVLEQEFLRRYAEGSLLQYTIKGNEEKGRGPMVVCLDLSSSMTGEKELWAKALCLGLLEIANRQRRRFTAICFTSAQAPLRLFELATRETLTIEMKEVLDLAEYFPGGGTDFEGPLAKALEILKRSRYRKGDVVFITDGEAPIRPAWREDFLKEKKKLDFTLFAVLVDKGSSSDSTLREISDEITTVTRLTTTDAASVFLKIR